jgi:vitamin B12 transporter
MKPFPSAIAGLAGLASLGAQAQLALPATVPSSEPVIVTASRGITPAATLRDATVITREDIEAAGPISLGELLQRRAGVELRAVGGAGQPQTLFVRGAGTAQTLVLVDGMRVGSATVGSTAIEHIPLEMIERIEVVKGPLSSLYGPEAIGGVVQVFTRGKAVPHLYVTAGYGSDDDRRISTGIVTEDGNLRLALNAGYRQVQAPSATNPRNTFGYNPDDDPHRNAFGNLRLSHRMWQGEVVEFEAFTTQSRTHFDAGPGNDRNDHAISAMKLSSSNQITAWWSSRISGGQGRDRLELAGSFPGFIETRQDQGAWINELAIPAGKVVVGYETVRQKVLSDEATPFSVTRRDTDSAFLSLHEAYGGHRFEGSIRRDKDDQFGARNTGAASYGLDLPWTVVSATYAQGFRAPTFFDLYGPPFPGAHANPALKPEESHSTEIALRSTAKSALRWRVSGFDHRFENLIAFSAADEMPVNVARARARGVELEGEMTWHGVRLRANFTAQKARNDDTGLRLQGRAERYGAVDASRRFGAWTVGAGVMASGPRYDSVDESPASRLPAYAVVDARVKYAFAKYWSAELATTNLSGKRYENAVGYDAPRRGVFLQVTFQAF